MINILEKTKQKEITFKVKKKREKRKFHFVMIVLF